jgi:hypothetical protein
MKIMLYEMKINKLCRVKMPITQNEEIVGKVQSVYDTHIVLDNLMGDKLKYDQYVFLYECIKLINESSIKEELLLFKETSFMEELIPKYIILSAMRHSVNIFNNMYESIKDVGVKVTETFDRFFQIEKMDLDSDYSFIFNSFYLSETFERVSNDELKEIKKKLELEISKFGRFWLLEGMFPKEDRKLWLEAIEILRNINPLVQDDIRDYLIMSREFDAKTSINLNTVRTRKQSKAGKDLDSSIHSKRRMSTSKKEKKKIVNMIDKSLPSPRKGQRKKTNQSSKEERSFESEDESIIRNRAKIPLILDGLRPPKVWNFPIDKLKKTNKDDFKTEIRLVDPRSFYIDGRVEEFFMKLREIYKNMKEYCKKKGNVWDYKIRRVFDIFGVAYQFSSEKQRKEERENTENDGNKTEEEFFNTKDYGNDDLRNISHISGQSNY